MPPIETNFEPSTNQTAIFAELIKPTCQHMVIEAFAGSGKTTTIMKGLELLPVASKTILVAFNAHIAKELEEKAPAHVKVSTLHSLGLSTFRREFPKFQIEPKKLYDILIALTEKLGPDQSNGFVSGGLKIIPLLKANLQEPTQENIEEIINYYSIPTPENYQTFLKYIKKAFNKSCTTTSVIDFDDMIYMPYYYNLAPIKYDYFFVDEAQDLNKAQLHLVYGSLKPKGRLIAVGDRHQSLYSFRGADADSIPNIISYFDAKVFPLSISYRCPTSVIKLAQKFVPGIEAAPGAIEGHVEDIDYMDFYDKVKGEDLCLCRYNAPLVKPCLNLITQGRKATIRGSDIGKTLITIIKSFKVTRVDQIPPHLTKWETHEVEIAERKRRNTGPIRDKADCIRAFMDGTKSNNVSDLIQCIFSIFSDQKAEIVFSSVHKAKGLEADAVFILEPGLMPCFHAEQAWELVQEDNIQYVAVTRTKDYLYFVEDY